MRFLLVFFALWGVSTQAYIVSETYMHTPKKQAIVLGDVHEPTAESGSHTAWLGTVCSQATTGTAFVLEDRAWENSYSPDGDTLHDFCFNTRKDKNRATISQADMRPKWMIWAATFAEDLQYAHNRTREARTLEKELTGIYGTAPHTDYYKKQLNKAVKELEGKLASHSINKELMACFAELEKLSKELTSLLPKLDMPITKAITTSKKQDKLLHLLQRVDIKYADTWFIIHTLELLKNHDQVIVYIGDGHTPPVIKAVQESLGTARVSKRPSRAAHGERLPKALDLTKCAWANKPSGKSAMPGLPSLAYA